MTEFNPDERVVSSGLQIDKIYCPSCNLPNPLGTTFCVHCSSYLGDLEDSPRQPAPDDEDALDTLIARKAEADRAAAEAAALAPAMPRNPSEPPPQPGAAGAHAVDHAALGGEEDGESGDLLASPVQLADGRLITRTSTLAKLERLQSILGDAGPLTGAREAKNEVVVYLEKKVTDQAALIEKLQKEKEAIIAEYMADALGSEKSEVDDDLLAKETARANRAETELARLGRVEAELSARMMAKEAEVAAALAEVEKVKGQMFSGEGGPAAGGGGADPAELAALRGQLAAAQQERQRLVAMAEAKLQQAEQEKERAIAMARQAMEQQDRELEQLRSRPPAGDAGGPELEAARSENARLKEQLGALTTGAKDQVRTVTRYYERILARTPCGVLVLAANGVILSVNGEGARLLGLGPADLLRKTYSEFPVLAPFHPYVQKLIAEGGELGPEVTALEPGRGDPIRIRFTAGKGELGAREVCVLVMDDLTPDPASMPPPGSSAPPGGGIEAGRAAAMQEDLFGLRMMLELLVSKATNPQVVQDVAGDLLKDLDRIIESLKRP